MKSRPLAGAPVSRNDALNQTKRKFGNHLRRCRSSGCSFCSFFLQSRFLSRFFISHALVLFRFAHDDKRQRVLREVHHARHQFKLVRQGGHIFANAAHEFGCNPSFTASRSKFRKECECDQHLSPKMSRNRVQAVRYSLQSATSGASSSDTKRGTGKARVRLDTVESGFAHCTACRAN